MLRLELLPSFDGLKTLDLSGTKIGLQDTSAHDKSDETQILRSAEAFKDLSYVLGQPLGSLWVQSESLGARALRRCCWRTWA